MPDARPPSPSPASAPGPALAIGAICLAAGGFIAAAGVGWIDLPGRKIRAPREVIVCAGLLFALAGVLVASRGRLPAWLGTLLAAVLATGFALIPFWLAFGTGPRAFTGSGTGFVSSPGFDMASVGRIVFGLIAVMMAAFAAFTWWKWAATLHRYLRVPALLGAAAALAWFLWARHLEPGWQQGETDHDRLGRYIAAKHAHPDFMHAAAGGGGSNPFLHLPQETWIKRARARIAAARVPPDATAVLAIPAGAAPTLDGVVEAAEWRDALTLPLLPAESGATVLLRFAGAKLYVGAQAPGDRTEQGFDQLRVYFHQQLSPHLDHERVLLGDRATVASFRAVVTGTPGRHRSERGILAQARGASVVQGHRQYELEIDLEEAGLASGAAFPLYVEIEGDPVQDAEGLFRERRLEGRSAAGFRPVWVRIAR